MDSASGRWDGFWCIEDDRYYARCQRDGSREQWFQIADETPRARIRETRVLPLRPRGGREYAVTRHMMLVTPADGSRAILIGGSRRVPRAQGCESAKADR
jgi:hypothetical protein